MPELLENPSGVPDEPLRARARKFMLITMSLFGALLIGSGFLLRSICSCDCSLGDIYRQMPPNARASLWLFGGMISVVFILAAVVIIRRKLKTGHFLPLEAEYAKAFAKARQGKPTPFWLRVTLAVGWICIAGFWVGKAYLHPLWPAWDWSMAAFWTLLAAVNIWFHCLKLKNAPTPPTAQI
jgi:hypothetical protein